MLSKKKDLSQMERTDQERNDMENIIDEHIRVTQLYKTTIRKHIKDHRDLGNALQGEKDTFV